jgi:hypothetical protein
MLNSNKLVDGLMNKNVGLSCTCFGVTCARTYAGTAWLHLCYVPYLLPLYTEVPRHCLMYSMPACCVCAARWLAVCVQEVVLAQHGCTFVTCPTCCLYIQRCHVTVCMCCTLACGLCAMRCAGTTWMHLANFGLQPSYMHRRDVHMLWLYLCKDLPCVCALIDWPAAIEHAGVTCTCFGFACARTCCVCVL